MNSFRVLSGVNKDVSGVKMELIVLGSGTATPSLARSCSGLFVRAGSLRILVDIGAGTIRRMLEAQIDPKVIDVILITHFHPDHVCDLVPFLFASNYAFGAVREEPFHVIGPNGLEQFFAGLVAVYQEWIVPRGNRLIKKEMAAQSADLFALEDVAIRSAPSPHLFPSLHYRIEAEGVSLTISGDTDMSPALVELAKGAEMLVSECSFPEGHKVPGHLVPSEAAAIAAWAGVGRLVLTHLYPPCDEVDVVKQAAGAFSGEIIKAEDLMRLTI